MEEFLKSTAEKEAEEAESRPLLWTLQKLAADFYQTQVWKEDNPYEARPCPVCHKLISNRANLKKHLKIRHSTQEEALCLYCRKVFRNKYSLWTHINSYHPGVKAANPQSTANAPEAGTSGMAPGAGSSSGVGDSWSLTGSESSGYLGSLNPFKDN
ncbi:hypothetical protein SK128_009268 [Halocaridina rubra]|uniref:C2H2-type domain-containing protein n=1 Tax=Halocaridina rubra TaxID=373956 RepID=A0AAN8WJW9_HALRR